MKFVRRISDTCAKQGMTVVAAATVVAEEVTSLGASTATSAATTGQEVEEVLVEEAHLTTLATNARTRGATTVVATVHDHGLTLADVTATKLFRPRHQLRKKSAAYQTALPVYLFLVPSCIAFLWV
ncbi:hypothetical protein FHG87_007385 [Trinorchestia longiramus]|nr:hypothetical protein FHG87_007385 [Trinorchestia longiramus]